MKSPFELHSTSVVCNDVKSKFDVGSASSSHAFLSTQPPEDPPAAYDTHHAQGFVHRNPTIPTGLHNLLSDPYLVPTICTSSIQSGSRLTGAIPSQKRNSKMIERQRRTEMRTLFSALRSLLPDENLRGKRSVSDQVEAATNYILRLQQKIEDLSTERDKMKAKVNFQRNAKVSLDGVQFSSNQKFCKSSLVQGSDGDQFPAVEIRSVGSGVQVFTKTFEYQNVHSDLLQALEEAGLEVLSAAFFGINNNKVFNTIHTKVHDLNALNIETLYQKLWHLIRNGHSQDL